MVSQEVKGYVSIVGGFLTHLVFGAFYLWGNISINVSSYYKYHGYPDITTSTVSAVFPTIYFGIAIGSQFGVLMARKFGHKLVSLVNMLVYGASLYLSTISNFYLFVLFMGFIPGICIGVEYLIPVDNAITYFPKKKGLISGIILCGLGFGALVFNPLLQVLLNPDNISTVGGYYPEDVADRLPSTYRLITILYMIIGILGVLMLFPPSNKDKVGDGNVQEQTLLQTEEDCEFQVSSVQDILKHKEVYISLFQFFCLTGFGFLMASHYKEFGLHHINDDSYFAIVGAIGGVANGLSRFLWSFLLDYVNDKLLVFFNIIMAMVLAGTVNMIADSKSLYLIWVSLTYLQYGGVYTLFPGICTKQFGKKWGPYAFNIAFACLPLSNLLQFILTKYMQQQFLDGQIFYVYVAINGSAFILQCFVLMKGKTHKQ